LKKSATARVIFALCRVVVVGGTCVSEEGMATKPRCVPSHQAFPDALRQEFAGQKIKLFAR